MTSHDAEGDTLTTGYQWTRNGTDIAGATASTLNLATAGNGDRGDLIRVRVTVNDGSLTSAPGHLEPRDGRQQRAGLHHRLRRRTDTVGDTPSLDADATDADRRHPDLRRTGLPSWLTISPHGRHQRDARARQRRQPLRQLTVSDGILTPTPTRSP